MLHFRIVLSKFIPNIKMKQFILLSVTLFFWLNDCVEIWAEIGGNSTLFIERMSILFMLNKKRKRILGSLCHPNRSILPVLEVIVYVNIMRVLYSCYLISNVLKGY